jgi:hypothetical protein
VGEFTTAELVTEEQEVANVATLRQQLDSRKQGVEARRRDLEKARNDLKKMAELYAEEKKLGEERYEKEKEERKKEVAQYKKQMEDMQAQMLLGIEQRLQQHTEALEKRSKSWFASSKQTKEKEAALEKLKEERAEQAKRAEEERRQYEAEQERKMGERDKVSSMRLEWRAASVDCVLDPYIVLTCSDLLLSLSPLGSPLLSHIRWIPSTRSTSGRWQRFRRSWTALRRR